MGHLERPTEPKPSGNNTPEVGSAVQVPSNAKAESDECPKIQVDFNHVNMCAAVLLGSSIYNVAICSMEGWCSGYLWNGS